MSIQYDPLRHLTRHPGGGVEVRIVVRNESAGRIRLTAAKIRDLEPLDNIEVNAAFANQFPGTPLRIIGGGIFSALDAGDLLAVHVIHAARDDSHFRFRCTNANGQDEDFMVPPGRYRVTIITSGKGAIGDEKAFIIDRNAQGELTFVAEEA